MASLAEIRAKLQSMESKSSGSSPAQSDNAIYPFWNIDEGTSTVLRFLPDSDPNNTFFWVERQMIRLTFPGVVGGDQKPTTVQVPCMEMFGENCPVLQEVRPWFKDPSLEDMGRKYWKKRSYIFQGFVNENPLNEEAPENPIRRFVIGPQIFNIIKSALMDPDMENIPTDYVNGTDFRLAKTMKGQYADYSTSKWARKERSLEESELAAIETHGLFDLKDFLPKKPTAEQVDMIYNMFQDSVNGELFDNDKYGDHFRPNGMSAPAKVQVQATTPPAQSSTPVAETTAPAVETPAPAVEKAPEVAPVEQASASAETTPSTDSKASAEDILAMIRNRQQ